jgi:membrane protease YdiL (CAAX protease family)
MPLVGYLEIGRRLAALGAPPTTTAELLLTAYFAIVNPLAEELFWRATVYERLRELDWPHWQSATVSSALFASWHVLPIALLVGKLIAIPAAAGVFLAGLAFATVHDRSRNCWVTISCHALAADVPLLVFCWLDVFHVL